MIAPISVRINRRSYIKPIRRLVLALLIVAPGLVGVAETTPTPPRISIDQARIAAEKVAQLIEKYYVFPEKRVTIARAVRKAASDHRYDVTDPYIFADRITDNLRSTANDLHLGVEFDPEQGGANAHPGPSSFPHPMDHDLGRRRNEGFEELKILPGNVRYVKITNFMWTNDVTAEVIDEVARFLSGGDAVIVDLRGNGGGNASAVGRLISYFMKDDDQLLMTFYDRMSGDTETSRVRDDLRAPRIVGKPFYTLIDGGTGSAAEEFAYHVQQFKLGSLVGEKTAEAANNNHYFPVEPVFRASISIGRPVHPVSKTNWEGVGIAPTDPVPALSALEQAQLMALRRLEQNASPTDQHLYAWTIEAVEARLHPLTVPSAQLETYCGKYGIRTVRLENSTLVFQREGRLAKPLIPIGKDLFAFADTDQIRLKFRRSGDRVVGFDQLTEDGQILPSDRDGQ